MPSGPTSGRSELTHVTISGNSARSEGGGIHIAANSGVNLRNSIIANNGAEDLACAGSAVTISASLIENNDSDCPAATYSDDPQLDGLTGSPAYFPLGYDSPAIGVGDATYCTASDQRGQARPQPAGTLCDIGAYERRTLRVTATAGPSLTTKRYANRDEYPVADGDANPCAWR